MIASLLIESIAALIQSIDLTTLATRKQDRSNHAIPLSGISLRRNCSSVCSLRLDQNGSLHLMCALTLNRTRAWVARRIGFEILLQSLHSIISSASVSGDGGDISAHHVY